MGWLTVFHSNSNACPDCSAAKQSTSDSVVDLANAFFAIHVARESQ